MKQQIKQPYIGHHFFCFLSTSRHSASNAAPCRSKAGRGWWAAAIWRRWASMIPQSLEQQKGNAVRGFTFWGTNISPTKAPLKLTFLFCKVVSWRVCGAHTTLIKSKSGSFDTFRHRYFRFSLFRCYFFQQETSRQVLLLVFFPESLGMEY